MGKSRKKKRVKKAKELSSPERRAFFRKLVRSSYAAPAVATVLLSSLQPGDPSGGMMTGPFP